MALVMAKSDHGFELRRGYVEPAWRTATIARELKGNRQAGSLTAELSRMRDFHRQREFCVPFALAAGAATVFVERGFEPEFERGAVFFSDGSFSHVAYSFVFRCGEFTERFRPKRPVGIRNASRIKRRLIAFPEFGVSIFYRSHFKQQLSLHQKCNYQSPERAHRNQGRDTLREEPKMLVSCNQHLCLYT